MVGIILASHGGFADGIYQSGEMIFGKQENVAHVILKPDEGPDDVRAKMEKAIASFDDDEEVLFLVDLWGGTPFNQANNLVEQHKDKWAIVAGMNLPMVIEAYASRFSMNTAHEIAAHIIETAKEGVKVMPESLQPKEAPKQAAAGNQPTGAIPEGTVIGDGKIKYVFARIDTRLLHGQVATGWTKAMNPNRIIVVSDNVAKDNLRKNMIAQAAPSGVKANTVPIKKMIEVAKDPRFGNTKAMLLFETPQDALAAIKGGVDIKELNVGSMAYSNGKVNVNQVLAMDQKDIDTFKELKELGVKFDVRKVPSSSPENMDSLLKKAQDLVNESK
ncbi:PTS mannose transporter subunit IIAB [Ligilactobacillus agilis]|mgnify:FL=1|uniref:PTS system mannose-specific EIIAB component n=1 Tax=Ligilactobacillus agilis TaxID=1601 RepID=A0A2I2ABN6_9LACO|nr:PTS sugar transporter subunit IIB [Ligilactobacillus agilis]MBM6773673.1 PTS mannose transporter subunit IIAB [Ligilactobacillus agilis]MCL8204618.1 PTS sugar transporter subunit IIB [Ligilactobacillus agilis]MDK6810197.1 PTS sugar transporter subunit IIB [Ligilactobacillus agilis]NME42932.1 PTS mannose transporter subunit IIAB [Ligilactobacillus agilis]PLA76805.1 PTS mannose transporter subunit IIAB [Ligilactobacillus agilis]